MHCKTVWRESCTCGLCDLNNAAADSTHDLSSFKGDIVCLLFFLQISTISWCLNEMCLTWFGQSVTVRQYDSSFSAMNIQLCYSSQVYEVESSIEVQLSEPLTPNPNHQCLTCSFSVFRKKGATLGQPFFFLPVLSWTWAIFNINMGWTYWDVHWRLTMILNFCPFLNYLSDYSLTSNCSDVILYPSQSDGQLLLKIIDDVFAPWHFENRHLNAVDQKTAKISAWTRLLFFFVCFFLLCCQAIKFSLCSTRILLAHLIII